MPAETDILLRRTSDVLLYVCFEQFLAHSRHGITVNICLVTIVTVGTIEIARRAYWLNHGAKGRCAFHLHRIGKIQIMPLVTLHRLILT